MRRPDFLIIGAQRAGTTSLFEDLRQHPAICLPAKKELHFFDVQLRRGAEWYFHQFPPASCAVPSGRSLTGEATPYYLFHPKAAERCFALVPDVRLIILLRNPVDRAHSHYEHAVSTGRESLSFEDALQAEEERLRDSLAILEADANSVSRSHRLYSYASRGIYVDQLARWTRLFPPERMLLLCSEELFQDPEKQHAKLYRFLGIPPMMPSFSRLNRGSYPKMSSDTRRRLIQFFEPHNARLYELLRNSCLALEDPPTFSSFWDC